MKKKKGKALYPPTPKYEEDFPEDSKPPQPEVEYREDQQIILGLISSLHLNSDYSDLTIICNDKILPAHKLVVCPRSKYFQNVCYSGFKETKNPILLKEKSPILVEKMLEFLYTGNYTTPWPAHTLGTSQPDGEDETEDRQPAEEPSRKFQPENSDTEVEVNLDEHLNETVTKTLEYMPETLVQGPQANEDPAPIDKFLQNHARNEAGNGGIAEPLVDPIINCHPCYFHVRMYGEADYFMIDDLKSKAEAHFCASFMSSPDWESIAETISELYSTRANYLELRQVAIEMIVGSLPNLRNGRTSVITSELMKSIPDFTYDLFQATLDKYVPEPSDMEQNQTRTEFDYWFPEKRY